MRTTGLLGPSGGTQTPRPTACPPPRARRTAEGPQCRSPRESEDQPVPELGTELQSQRLAEKDPE